MTSTQLVLRCKSKTGQQKVQGLTSESTVKDLKTKLSELSTIAVPYVKVLYGFPPKPLELGEDSQLLSCLPIKSGETLVIEEHAKAKEEREKVVLSQFQEQMNARGLLTRDVVPANNSCLFTSVYFVMNNGEKNLAVASTMRKLIIEEVSSNPQVYTSAFLGRSNADYCAFILSDETWGGGIELSILSKYFKTEIAVVDIQSGRIDRFGEDKHYSKRVFLIYDGIHYDPLILEPADPSTPRQTKFSTNDDIIMSQALELGAEAKQAKNFTDVSRFALRCMQCNVGLVGQDEAQKHAKQTGHINFGEY